MNLGRLAGVCAAVASLAGALAAAPASAVTITEFPANPKTIFSFPLYITSGPDGNLWWTDIGTEPGIARMSPSGEYFPRIPDPNKPIDLVVAPSGYASWTSEGGQGMRTPAGVVKTESFFASGGAIILTPDDQVRWGFRLLSTRPQICTSSEDHIPLNSSLEECETDGGSFGQVTGLAMTSGGVLWAGYYDSDRIRTVNPPLEFDKVIDLPENSGPTGMAVGPEGNAWVAMYDGAAIDRIGLDGTRTRFPLPPKSRPEDIVLGPDGAFWITESGTGKIGRMTTAGVLTNEYPVPSGEINQVGITVGPDQNIWFTDPEVGRVARLVPDPPVGPPADTVAPSFTGKPSFSPNRFRAAGKVKASASRKGAAPSGSKLKFSLSEAAKVTATIARKKVVRGKARYVKVGALTATGKQGANKVPFSGKLKGKRLAPGAYRATLTARDAAGNVSAPKTASFTIVR